MADLSFSLHPRQAEVFNSPARFNVVPAGRQSGKTTVAIAKSIEQALSEVSVTGKPVTPLHEVGYIFPTFEQGKRVVWPRIRDTLRPLGDAVKIYENTGHVVFPNRVTWRLLGADNQESLRGPTFRFVVLDEFKDMSPTVFDEILRPALTVAGGGALFIGTPKGKNHFYELYKYAKEANDPEWAAFTFTSADNPAIDAREIMSMTRKMSSHLIRQEIEASFISQGGSYFQPEWFPISETEPADGDWAIAVDLAGFEREGQGRSADYHKRDETAIAIVKVHRLGWWVKEIVHGRWDTRETALRILLAAKSVGTGRVGIEKGALLAAVEPYLRDLMRQYGRWLNLEPLSHGNKSKADRIQWGLQGRAEKRQITLNKGAWNAKLIEQACDFPDPRSHDDLLDALAYIDQIAVPNYLNDFEFADEFKPVDALVGF